MPRKKIKTQTVSRGVAKSNTVTLTKTPNTRLRFEPTLHSGGVRGKLIRYKKSSKAEWKELSPSEFNSQPLGIMEKVTIELDTEAMASFLASVEPLKAIVDQGIPDGTHNFAVGPIDKTIIINEGNKFTAIKALLDGGYTDDFWKSITDNQPQLANKLAAGRFQQVRKEIVLELKERLEADFSETTGPDSW